MIDLVYFGYPHESHSEASEKEFKRDIVKVFPNVKLDDAYDEIKGYRQKVTLPENDTNNYYAWLIEIVSNFLKLCNSYPYYAYIYV